jgi:hypothetical protein
MTENTVLAASEADDETRLSVCIDKVAIRHQASLEAIAWRGWTDDAAGPVRKERNPPLAVRIPSAWLRRW